MSIDQGKPVLLVLLGLLGFLHGLIGSMVGHISIAPGFRPWLGYARSVFHLSLRLITIVGHLAHLAYLMHKSGCKQATFKFFLLGLSAAFDTFDHTVRFYRLKEVFSLSGKVLEWFQFCLEQCS